MSIHQTALHAIKELDNIIEDMKFSRWREDFCEATLNLRLREIRGALRHDLWLPDNCPDCNGKGGKTLEDGCYQECFSCKGSGAIRHEYK